MKTKYIAEDGKLFDIEKDCARHELKNCEGVLDKLEAGIAKAPHGFQIRWCSSGACACMGCINREFYKMELTQAHWEVWMEEFRKEIPIGKEENWNESNAPDSVTVVLKHYGDNKSLLISAIKNITGLGAADAYNLLRPDSEIKVDINYFDAVKFKKHLESVGATVEIVEFLRQKKSSQFK